MWQAGHLEGKVRNLGINAIKKPQKSEKKGKA